MTTSDREPSVAARLWAENKGLALFLALMFVFRSAVADWNYVPSSSMNPTLLAGDRVMVNKLAYSLRVPFTLIELLRWDSPHRGDVITLDSPADGVTLIKRVVAVAGDSFEMRDNHLFINGQEVRRDLADPDRVIPSEQGDLHAQVWTEHWAGQDVAVAQLIGYNSRPDFGLVVVPPGQLMVMGDSRDNSNDSRYIGFIDTQRVTGQAVRVVMSHDASALYLPRGDRWWLPLHL